MAKKKKSGAEAKKRAAQPAKAAPARAKRPPAKTSPGPSAAGLWEKSTQFLREVVQELKRVTWPSRKQTISSTGVVLALVILVSIFLGVVDFVLSRLVRFLIG